MITLNSNSDEHCDSICGSVSLLMKRKTQFQRERCRVNIAVWVFGLSEKRSEDVTITFMVREDFKDEELSHEFAAPLLRGIREYGLNISSGLDIGIHKKIGLTHDQNMVILVGLSLKTRNNRKLSVQIVALVMACLYGHVATVKLPEFAPLN